MSTPTPERREPCMSEYKHYASAVDLERELYLGEPGMSTIEVFSTDCGVMDFATELLTVDEIRDRAQAEIDEIFAEANAEANVVDCGEDTCAREPECDYHAGDLVEFPDDEEDEDEIR